MILLLKLFLAHLLGDFMFQPAKWVEAKEKRRIKAYQLYVHGLLHGIIIMLLVWNWSFWPWELILAASHLFIDALKLLFQEQKTNRIFFFVDNLSNLLIIYIV